MQTRRPKHRSHIEEYQGKGPDTFGRGRRCRGCRAFLSMYNPADRCSACFPQGRRLVKVSSRDHAKAVGDWQELTEGINFQEFLEDPYSEAA